MSKSFFLDIDFTKELNLMIEKIVELYGDSLREVSLFLLQNLLVPLDNILITLPPVVFLLLVGALVWYGFRDWKMTLLCVFLLYLIGSFGLWEKTMQTLSIMLVCIAISVLIGLPVGVLMAYSKLLSKILRPVLDTMQTFPMFVYMLPVVMLFSIGKIPAVIATVIYSLPPLIRLTELGILQVDKEVKEAARSFGASGSKMLFWVFLPLARPSIMTGINQTTMMALAMVVVCSMIGARGLGEDILYGITTLDFGRGFKAGISIVILAFLIDRITQAYGMSVREKHKKYNTSLPLA